MKRVSIVIPAYNEEKRIGKTLKSIKSNFQDSEVIVVSNGSKDKTVEVVGNFCKGDKKFKLLEFNEKLGKGGAVLEGLRKANTKFVGFLDADDAFDLNEIKKMIKHLNNYDGVIASKWKGQNLFNVNEPFVRKLLSRVWNSLVKGLFGLKFRDTQAGAKFFRKEVLDLDDFVCKDFSFDIELLYRLKKFKVKEFYIPSKFQIGSKFSYKHIISMLKNMVKLKLR